MADIENVESSRLENVFAGLEIERRRVSLNVQHVWRHPNTGDPFANDLDFNYNPDPDSLLPNLNPSMQDILPAFQYSSHLANLNNFADETSIECFDQTSDRVEFLALDSSGLEKILKTVKLQDASDASAKSTLLTTEEAPRSPYVSTQSPSSTTPNPANLTTNTTQAATQARQTPSVANASKSANSNNGSTLEVGEALHSPSVSPQPPSFPTQQIANLTQAPNLATTPALRRPSASTRTMSYPARNTINLRMDPTLAAATASSRLSVSTASSSTAETVHLTIDPTLAAGPALDGPSVSTSPPIPKTANLTADPNLSASSTKETNTSSRLLVFFVSLEPKTEASFAAQVSMQRSSVQMLFKMLGVNPEYLLNLLGRPDYWSPRTRWQYNMNDELTVCDYFCQYPRWNIEASGAPLSVYIMQQIQTKLTVYIISHKAEDSSIYALKQMLKLGGDLFGKNRGPSIYLTNPFEIAVVLSFLSFEASKYHVARFRRYMWQQVNKVDDHLAGLVTSDRVRLTELTKSLQIISQQADSHLLNGNVAIITASGIHETQAKLHDYLSSPKQFRQPAEDRIKYVIDSLNKQMMLFLNYKSRKDGTMNLVYNLVTQADASNNIRLSQSMKQDSTSMNAIAALTMLFLPGTFTSSILSAGIFSAGASSTGIATSSLWWFWVVITLPLTVVVLAAWWIYKLVSNDDKLYADGEEPKRRKILSMKFIRGKLGKKKEGEDTKL